MPVTVLNQTEPARHRLIREVVQALIDEFPLEMREIAQHMRDVTARQLDPKTGKWRDETDANCYFKVSFPQVFMDVLRPIMRRQLPDEPPFADDDSDLIFLMKIVPDLIGGKKRLTEKRKKDYRTRTRLK